VELPSRSSCRTRPPKWHCPLEPEHNERARPSDQPVSGRILADFGGSRYVELSLDGGLLPDDLFSDPCLLDYKSPKVNVFSLGVVIYVIMTGHYPFCNSPAPRGEERFVYSDQVRALFKKGVFPKLSSVPLGDIIARCCHERSFDTAKEVVEALEIEMSK
jgi:serine/threonine protein kinase